MTPTAQRAGFVTGGRQLSGSASACAQTQAESAVKPGGRRCVAGTQASRREVHSGNSYWILDSRDRKILFRIANNSLFKSASLPFK